MTLAQYLKKSDTTAAELAQKLGVSHVAVWRWVTNKCAPRAGVAVEIERISKGAVTVSDLLPGKTKRRRHSRRAA